MTAFNAFPDKVDCPRRECIWNDEPERKGNCNASACPFTQETRDRWFNLQAEIERTDSCQENNEHGF